MWPLAFGLSVWILVGGAEGYTTIDAYAVPIALSGIAIGLAGTFLLTRTDRGTVC